jgi:hypothetical protein
MSTPWIRQLTDFPRRGGVEECKRIVKHRHLLGNIARLAQRVTKRPAQEQRSWRPHLFGDIAEDGQGDRRKTGSLNCALDQSDGPIADSSGGREKNEVRPLAANVS